MAVVLTIIAITTIRSIDTILLIMISTITMAMDRLIIFLGRRNIKVTTETVMAMMTTQLMKLILEMEIMK